MDFPAKREQAAEPPPGMLAALGLSGARYVGRNEFDYLVEVDAEAQVRALAPDFTGLGRIAARGVIVTSRAAPCDFDYVARVFGPAAGVNEDPPTPSPPTSLP